MKIARREAFVFLAVMLGIIDVDARSTGAPVGSNPEICDTMIPGHGIPAQDTKSPFSIIPAKMKYMPGKKFSVTINATQSQQFKGIFMQMRRNDTDAIVGTWSVMDADKFKTVSCAGVEDNAVTHVDKTMKGTVNKFMWTPPKDFDDAVYVAATFVESYSSYWVKQTSSTISADTKLTSSLILTIVMISISLSTSFLGLEF
eukprot:XP_011675459.1 PREDICTED: putative defense protein 3 [Strongylocentrotus purpuratus]